MTVRQHPAAHADDDTQTQIVGAAALDFTMVVTAVMRDPSLSRDARTLYAILVSYASISGDDRGVWPANATLAAQLGCSVDSTRRYLRELADAGLVTVTGRRKGDGAQTSNLITLHDRSRLAGVAAAPPAPSHPRKGAPSKAATPPLAPVPPELEPVEREPLNENQRTNPPLAPLAATDDPASSFEAFWNAYPRKTSKGHARRAWTTATKNTPPERILAAVAAQRPVLASTDPRFIPHPATWLNGERWLDPAPKVRDPRVPEGWGQPAMAAAGGRRDPRIPEGW